MIARRRWRTGPLIISVIALVAATWMTKTAVAAAATGSTYVSLTPTRLLDTRTAGPGGTDAPLGQEQTRSVQITGQGGVPTDPSLVTAVMLNLTVVDSTDTGYIKVFPDGAPLPLSTNLNFMVGQTVANMVVSTVSSADGSVDVFNLNGSTDVLVDLIGYYTPATSGTSTFNAVTPTRVLDTRNGTGGQGGTPAPIGPGQTRSVQVEGVNDGVPTTGVTAVVLNVTVTNPTANSSLTVFGDGTAMPATSNLDFAAGQTIANLAVVAVPANTTKIDIFNQNGTTDVVADVFGYYTSGSGATFTPVGPTRLLDTRHAGPGGGDASLPADTSMPLAVTNVAGVPATGVTSVVLHVTVVNPTVVGFLTVYPDGIGVPRTSNMNYTAGALVSNLVIVPVGADGQIDFWSNAGTIDLVVDLFGYFSSS